MGDPIGLGFNAVAYAALCQGRFAEALELAHRAVAIWPGRLGFDSVLDDALSGTQSYERLLDRARTSLAEDSTRTAFAMQEITYLRLLGRTNELQTSINKQVNRIQNMYDAETESDVRHYLLATDAIVQGDIARTHSIKAGFPQVVLRRLMAE